MAVGHSFLSLERFETLYEDQKPHVEYWFGDAIPKRMADSSHGVCQWVLAMLVAQRGWKTATEVRLKLTFFAHPVPDVIAYSKAIQSPYPTEPFDLCIEIISPDDDLRTLFRKGAHYLDWGIGCVWIIDPVRRMAYLMSREEPVPQEVNAGGCLTAGSNLTLRLSEFFAEVDKRL